MSYLYTIRNFKNLDKMSYDIIDYLDYHGNEKYEKRKYKFQDYVKISSINDRERASLFINEFNTMKENIEIDNLIFYDLLHMIEDSNGLYFELNRIGIENILKKNLIKIDEDIEVKDLEELSILESFESVNHAVSILSNEMYYKYIQIRLEGFSLTEVQQETLERGLINSYNLNLSEKTFEDKNHVQNFVFLYQLGVIDHLESKYPDIGSSRMGYLLANICNAEKCIPTYCRLYRASNTPIDKNYPLTDKNIEFANEIINKKFS